MAAGTLPASQWSPAYFLRNVHGNEVRTERLPVSASQTIYKNQILVLSSGKLIQAITDSLTASQGIQSGDLSALTLFVAMNDISTMNKIMEYMTLEKPSVQFDLKEGRTSAGDASLYARANDPKDFAAKLAWLIDHPEEGRRMGQEGRKRVLQSLSWDSSVPHLLAAYDRIFGRIARSG